MVSDLPPGPYRLVDNRIVAGDSSWLTQPVTICTLHPKQNKAEHRSFVPQLRDALNAAAAREPYGNDCMAGTIAYLGK
jgi:hypothetical protein